MADGPSCRVGLEVVGTDAAGSVIAGVVGVVVGVVGVVGGSSLAKAKAAAKAERPIAAM